MSAVFSGYKSGDQCKVLTFERFMVVKDTFLAIFWVSLRKEIYFSARFLFFRNYYKAFFSRLK